MAGRDTALAFGALVAGGVVIEYGVKALRSGFSSSTTAAGASSDAGGLDTGVPANATQAVANALDLAHSLVGAPYSKANHAASFTQTVAQIKQMGTDCSGLVSLLCGPRGLGILDAPQTTQTIYTQPGISPGAGDQVTIYDRFEGPTDDEHVIIKIAGEWFESGGMSTDGQGGVRQLTSAQAQTELSGDPSLPFHAFHPDGM